MDRTTEPIAPATETVPAGHNGTGNAETTSQPVADTSGDVRMAMDSENTTKGNTMNDTVMMENAQTAQEPGATGAQEATGASTPNKRMLYRHPSQGILGGVCSGIADFTGMDAALIRILWFVATVATGGGGILAYATLWLLLPVGSKAQGQVSPPALELNERNLGRAALVLISLGVLWLLANVGILPWLWGGFWRVMSIVFWPALLIGIGYLILRYTGRGDVNWDWRKSAEQARSQVGERMPTRASLGERFGQMRMNFPLKRSHSDRIFMGVCGGIGERTGIDANLVRLVWAAMSVGSIGVGVLVYVLVGLFLPEAPRFDPNQDENGQEIQVIDVKTTQV